MPTLSEYREKKGVLIKAAQKALTAGDLDKGKRLRAQAEKIQETIIELEATRELMKTDMSSRRPPMPTAVSARHEQSKPQDATDRAAAAYVTRFGTVDQTVKGILTDLHGANYEAAYWMQRQSFGKYLRRGQEDLSREEIGLLKSVILTPSVVKSALLKGIDSVETMKTTMVEAVDTLGGFTVPIDFQTRVIERLQGLTIMRGRASTMETSRDQVEYPVSTTSSNQYSSAVRVTWVDETPTAGAAATNLTWGSENIPVHTVMAESALSRNLVEDAAFDIEGFLVDKLSEASAVDEDNQFLVGTGIGTPQGILPGSTNALSLTHEQTATNDVLAWADLIDIVYKVPTQYRQKAVWVANRTTYGKIANMQTASGYDYLWTPWQYAGGADGAPPKLQGYETLEQEAMPDIADGSFPMIFGDLAGYQIVDRIGMTVERYLDSATARQNMVMYVMRRRLGGQVVEPWRFAVMKIQ